MESETIKKALDMAIKENNPAKITALRGRLIKEYNKEINILLKDEDISEEEKNRLIELKSLIQEEIVKHKAQVSGRYSNEFIHQKAKINNIFSLPNAISLAVEKVKTCIQDLRNSKENKEKTGKRMEVLKSFGLLAATPFVYLGKFVLDQWYIAAGVGAFFYFKNNPAKLLDVGNRIKDFYGNVTTNPQEIISDFNKAIGIKHN